MPTLPITLPIHQVASERGQQPLIGLEEVLEAALLDLQQRHVRQEIVAHLGMGLGLGSGLGPGSGSGSGLESLPTIKASTSRSSMTASRLKAKGSTWSGLGVE